jgi:hypothetical protein
LIASQVFSIKSIQPDGTFSLDDPLQALPESNTSGVSYTLLDGSSNSILTGTEATLTVSLRGRVQVLSTDLQDIRNILFIGDYVILDQQYPIIGYVTETVDQLYILGYSDGEVAGTNLEVWQRLATNEIGYLGYQGMQLQTNTNYESVLQINNGANPPAYQLENNLFMQNFLVAIGSDYYSIANIDGTTITLSGPSNYWMLLADGGTSVTFNIYKYSKQPITIGGMTFDFIDRRGAELVTNSIDQSHVLSALNKRGNEIVDSVSR